MSIRCCLSMPASSNRTTKTPSLTSVIYPCTPPNERQAEEKREEVALLASELHFLFGSDEAAHQILARLPAPFFQELRKEGI